MSSAITSPKHDDNYLLLPVPTFLPDSEDNSLNFQSDDVSLEDGIIGGSDNDDDQTRDVETANKSKRQKRTKPQPSSHSCPHCQESFTYKGHLHDHIKSTHEKESPFRCEICQKILSSTPSLHRHMLQHSQEKPFQCEICQMTFNADSSLTTHMRTHTGEKPFKCRFCPSAFCISVNLKNHLRSHTGEKPYFCGKCFKSFLTSSDLKRHDRIHSGDKPFGCEICPAAFNQSTTFKDHMKRHMVVTPFFCDVCRLYLATGGALTAHMQLEPHLIQVQRNEGIINGQTVAGGDGKGDKPGTKLDSPAACESLGAKAAKGNKPIPSPTIPVAFTRRIPTDQFIANESSEEESDSESEPDLGDSEEDSDLSDTAISRPRVEPTRSSARLRKSNTPLTASPAVFQESDQDDIIIPRKTAKMQKTVTTHVEQLVSPEASPQVEITRRSLRKHENVDVEDKEGSKTRLARRKRLRKEAEALMSERKKTIVRDMGEKNLRKSPR
ncbi:hypothetical protein BDR26DRAFT_925467, partial [Obelidium mucronatum]